MELRILGFHYKNIRQFSDLGIDLTAGGGSKQPHPISLIQMPNGMGKTTTMALLRHCLTGDWQEAKDGGTLEPEAIRSFKCLVNQSTKGEFELRLSVDGDPIFITLSLDYEKGTAHYYTARIASKGGGRTSGWNLPEELKTRFSQEFVRLFIFDGELANAIRDLDRDEAEHAIKTLCYLDKLAEIRDVVIPRILEKRQQEALTKIVTTQAERALRTQVRESEQTLQNLQREQKEMLARRDRAKREHDEIKLRIDGIISKNEEALRIQGEQRQKSAELTQKLTARTLQLLEELRKPQNLTPRVASQLKGLAELMGRLRLPRTQSAEFFHELADQPECICGRPLEPEHRDSIRRKAKEYLREDQIGVINAIKSSIRNLPEREDVGKLCEEIVKFDQDRQRAEQLLAQVGQRLTGGDRERVDALRADQATKVEEAKEAQIALDGLQEKDRVEQKKLGLDWDTNIPLCDERITELRKKLADATKTVSFYKRSEALKVFVDEVINRSLSVLKEDIRSKTNSNIKRFLGRSDVSVESIESGLKIQGRTDVSQGQSLAIAYAYLCSLFSESPHKFPFVVDSPVGPMDIEVRREVGQVIPDMFPQLVVFIISSERVGFVDKISGRKHVQYTTVYESPKGSGRVTVSQDPKVFHSFHSEEEA